MQYLYTYKFEHIRPAASVRTNLLGDSAIRLIHDRPFGRENKSKITCIAGTKSGERKQINYTIADVIHGLTPPFHVGMRKIIISSPPARPSIRQRSGTAEI